MSIIVEKTVAGTLETTYGYRYNDFVAELETEISDSEIDLTDTDDFYQNENEDRESIYETQSALRCCWRDFY